MANTICQEWASTSNALSLLTSLSVSPNKLKLLAATVTAALCTKLKKGKKKLTINLNIFNPLKGKVLQMHSAIMRAKRQ